ncbi:TonB-dependent receptor [Glaciecola petra]|uniref:TonB-dependent receptor n=1 Tax=Glaciecola petra TaxID=3075602 RepID=A0ABU2ZWQ7_9ALTE|nr:TonB-dependent receptor [Aestuariibacter sp. P117]MDT0596453.1 TonB-dependent receptor [Aestuariibacter sp. P117]
MKTQLNKISSALRKRKAPATFFSAMALAMMSVPAVNAQEEAAAEDTEVIEVSGIRASLVSALAEKRNAPNLIEVINADDVGKLPDQNLAEVLENITGIQITRTAGIGTGVQIRGSNANRIEINGVSTVGAGSGRNGISFEDVNASIISSVEVTKAPQASTIEGSVGGTINLRTIRPLELTETLGSVRVQLEESSLSVESPTPRLSGAYGDNWETDSGRFGFVVSGSYTEQEAVSFRPRTDRDNLVNIDGVPEFQGIQFLVQEQENNDYETVNLSTTFEFAPTDNMKFHFDAIINQQERSQDSYRLQASGVSSLRNISVPEAFETINYGVVNGTNIGTYQAALRGTLEPNLAVDDDDPNLRFSSDTGARVTDSSVFTFGGEWQGDNLKVSAEISSSSADTENPNLSTTLNFINPNCPLDGTSNDNCVPFRYDLSNNSLSFGINFDSPFAPTTDQLLDPNNVVLDQVQVGDDTTENSETAFRVDFEYFVDQVDFISSVDFGFRVNKATSKFEDIGDNIGGFSRMVDSPNGALFSDLLVAGPNNYGDADGRDLFIANFLLLDPDASFSDRQNVIDTLQAAVIQHDPDSPDILNVRSNNTAFRDIEESTTAIYAQANFEFGDMVTGNIGVRYIETDIDSTGFNPDDQLETTSGSYDFVLPRLNLTITPHDDVVVRFAYGTDVRRPNFNQLATGFTLDTSENSVVALGNPGLEPEEVDSFDIGVEWYFAESAVVSVGYFKKDRTNIFGIDFEGAALIADPSTPGGLARETDPSCPGGGIFNPIVVPNVLGDPSQLGLCVDKTTPGNDPETTTQTGVEMAFQYDLSSFEDDLGWASGFGVIANYTIQDFSGGSVVDTTSGRGLQVLGDVSIERGLLDFSENAYNFTLYYEKYGISARMRYTWREAFRTQDFGGGANTSGSSTLSFPVVTADRGQLNASISYDVTDKFNIGLEAVNLTEERIDQYCVAEDALLCFVGLPDRRITLGASYRW